MTTEQQREMERFRREREKQEQAEEIAERLTDFVNGWSREDTLLIVEALSRKHRTLQQGATRFVLAWLKHLADLPEHGYDPRNQASVEVAREIDRAINLSLPRLPVI